MSQLQQQLRGLFQTRGLSGRALRGIFQWRRLGSKDMLIFSWGKGRLIADPLVGKRSHTQRLKAPLSRINRYMSNCLYDMEEVHIGGISEPSDSSVGRSTLL